MCWWNGAESIANPPTSRSVPPAAIPLPDFLGWQEAFETSPVREHVRPQLVMEGSRGCWWGEKHQCTFCGLNGSMIGFRSKPADRFLDELSTLVRRHQILDVLPVDNILDMNYFRTVLPAMADLEWDLRVHYEIKSNIRTDYRRGPGFLQVKDMRDPAAAARMIIDDGALGSAFTHCLRPRRLPDLGAAERDAVDVLIDERLVLRCGDLVVTLPNRMRRWPVPAMSV
ncbi:DUF5825 family protein [Nonomuraea diastatica]|uniref:DUF5825 family protein n=1 Tax=Nonomuraea diastatica TaxID=1848329 RepID=UPI001C6FE101|nr:DUF5825 family protein [Nonomuraea diastatica]